MSCMCGDSQCPSCGVMQETKEPEVLHYKISTLYDPNNGYYIGMIDTEGKYFGRFSRYYRTQKRARLDLFGGFSFRHCNENDWLFGLLINSGKLIIIGGSPESVFVKAA